MRSPRPAKAAAPLTEASPSLGGRGEANTARRRQGDQRRRADRPGGSAREVLQIHSFSRANSHSTGASTLSIGGRVPPARMRRRASSLWCRAVARSRLSVQRLARRVRGWLPCAVGFRCESVAECSPREAGVPGIRSRQMPHPPAPRSLTIVKPRRGDCARYRVNFAPARGKVAALADKNCSARRVAAVIERSSRSRPSPCRITLHLERRGATRVHTDVSNLLIILITSLAGTADAYTRVSIGVETRSLWVARNCNRTNHWFRIEGILQ
jgi:hypothetical protein